MWVSINTKYYEPHIVDWKWQRNEKNKIHEKINVEWVPTNVAWIHSDGLKFNKLRSYFAVLAYMAKCAQVMILC